MIPLTLSVESVCLSHVAPTYETLSLRDFPVYCGLLSTESTLAGNNMCSGEIAVELFSITGLTSLPCHFSVKAFSFQTVTLARNVYLDTDSKRRCYALAYSPYYVIDITGISLILYKLFSNSLKQTI